MKKTFKICIIVFFAFFLAACTIQPAVNTDGQPLAQGCVFKDGQCCKDDSCATAMPNCQLGTTPVVRGCDKNCVPIDECVSADGETGSSCFEMDGACCPTNEPCAMSAPKCPSGTQPIFEGCDEDCSPIFDCIIEDSDFLIYTNSQPAFRLKYPKSWQVSVETAGVRTSIVFKDLENGYEGNGNIVSTLSYAPNQGRVSLSEWEGEIKKSGGWIPVLTKKPTEIGGVIAKNLILPESQAGSRYIFISADRMMYDWQFVGVTSEIVQEIISSHAFGQ